jgi:hypothetical protein
MNLTKKNLATARLGIISEADGQISFAVAQSIKDAFFAHLMRLGVPCTAPELQSTGNCPQLAWHMTAHGTKENLFSWASTFARGNGVEMVR